MSPERHLPFDLDALLSWQGRPALGAGEFLALLVVVALITLLCYRLLARAFDRALRRRRLRHAKSGERLARRLLTRDGYRIVAEQANVRWPVRQGKHHLEIRLTADFLLEKSGLRYVGEVKTGRLVTSLHHAPTRRQLLEYQLAFEAHGVLLIDAEARRVQRVEFPRAFWQKDVFCGSCLASLGHSDVGPDQHSWTPSGSEDKSRSRGR